MKPDIPCKDAWTRARDRYAEDLSDDEKALYENASPEALFYDASAAAKVHASSSSSLNAFNKLQPLIAAIEQYGQALDVFSNAYPLALSPLWGSIRVLLHLAQEFGKYFDKVIEMLARIGDVLPRFRVYENLFPSHERLVQAISLAYVDVLNFCAKAKTVFRHGRRSSLNNLSVAFKLSWKPFDRQFGQQIDDFRAHLKNVEKEVGLSHMLEAADSRALVLANQRQLERIRKENKHRQIMMAIPSVNSESKHKKVQALRYPGTGLWLLESDAFRLWRDPTYSSRLCCHGIPGCGKTVLASTIIDELKLNTEHEAARVIYCYCDYADQSTLQTNKIIGTLLKQLFVNGYIPEQVEAKIPLKYTEGQESLGVNELMDLVYVAIRLDSPTYIILDGLDECEKETRQNMVSLFDRLSKLEEAIVKLMIMCRDEDQLLSIHSLHDIPRVRMSPAALEGDIKAFITGSVSSRIQSGELKIRNPRLEDEIVSELVSKAHGMFLWVFFQLDDLCEAPSDAMLRESLRNLPNGLVETYERILEKIGKNDMKSTVARKIFRWTVAAQRPMKLAELREAVAFGPSDTSWDLDKLPDEDLMIESCRGLVVRDRGDGTVRFAHHTIRQYLLSDDVEKRYKSFACGKADLFVGEMCLTYLCFSDFDTQVAVRTPETEVDQPSDLLQADTVFWMSNLLGVPRTLLRLSYRLLGRHAPNQVPGIDYAKYFRPAPTAIDNAPSEELRGKYELLVYVIDNWMFHTRDFDKGTPKLRRKLHEVARHKNLPFEFRPWGPNQHHQTPYGCISCVPGRAADIAAKDLPFMALFHYAAKVGHWPLMEPLIDDYCSHEDGDDEGLLNACRNGHGSIVRRLIERYQFDLSDGKAINVTAASGYEDIFTYLLEVSSRSYSVVFDGHHPLIIASENGHEGIVEILCEQGAHIDARVGRFGKSAVSAAATNGHDGIVRNLIARGATTNTTSLQCAAENGHDAVVRTILEMKQYEDRRLGALDWKTETPLHKASRNGHTAVVKTLLDRSPVTQNWIMAEAFGRMAIHMAAANGHLGVIELLSAVVSIDSTTAWGETPLMIAAAGGHVPTIEFLTQHGADISIQDKDGYTALERAVLSGHEEAVRALFEVEPLSVDRGSKSLILAARERHEGVLTAIIAKLLRPESVLQIAASSAEYEKLFEAAELLRVHLSRLQSEQWRPSDDSDSSA